MKLETTLPLHVKAMDAHTNRRLPDVAVTVSIPRSPGRRSLRGRAQGFGISSAANRDGKMKIDWLPGWAQNQKVSIWGSRTGYVFGEASTVVGTRGNLVTIKMRPLVRLHGRVVHADGSPEVGIVVESANVSMHLRDRVQTDEDGHYEFFVPPDTASVVSVVDSNWAAVPWPGSVQTEAASVNVPELVLKPVQRLYGRVSYRNRPVVNQEISLHVYGPPSGDGKWPARPIDRDAPYASRSTWTDEMGRYEFHVGPGVYKISGPERIESVDGVLFERAPAYWSLNIIRDAESRRHDFNPSLWTSP